MGFTFTGQHLKPLRATDVCQWLGSIPILFALGLQGYPLNISGQFVLSAATSLFNIGFEIIMRGLPTTDFQPMRLMVNRLVKSTDSVYEKYTFMW